MSGVVISLADYLFILLGLFLARLWGLEMAGTAGVVCASTAVLGVFIAKGVSS